MTNLEKNASGLLRIAVRRMARSYPFHAHLLLPERFVCVPEVDTIGVTICDARLQFWYAPDFICRCSLDELAASLHHEVNHILFEHLLANPDEFPDQRARIIAEEVTANEWIVEPLPGSPITLDQFPNLPPLEDTETRYARLVGDSMSKGRRTTQLGQETVRSGPDLVQAGRKPARFGEKTGAYPLDNHDIWKSIRVNPLVGRLVISAAVHQAKAQLKPTDWQNVPTTLRDQIDHVIHNVQSSEVINPQGNGAVDWGRVLRQFIAKCWRDAQHCIECRADSLT